MKKITIIIPCYNEERSLDVLYERLHNVFSQMNEYSFQILLVNDGSKDNTVNVVREFEQDFKVLKL